MRISKRLLVVFFLCVGTLVLSLVYAKILKLPHLVKESIKNKINNDFVSSQVESIKTNANTNVKALSFRFVLLSDIHNNHPALGQAVSEINTMPVDFVVGLGDYTNVGTEAELNKIKAEFNLLTKPYYTLPGDHDLWNGRDKKNEPRYYFDKIFERPPKTITRKNVKLVFLDNADLYKGVSEDNLSTALSELENPETPVTIVLSHKAIYHPLTIHRMGYIQEDEVQDVLNQALLITDKVSKLNNHKVYLIHGDLHSSSSFTGPTDNITNYTIGALTKDKNFQTPRYAMVEVYEDNSIKVRDMVVK